MNGNTTPRCCDCGAVPECVDHLVLWSQSAQIGKRLVESQICNRCLRRRGAQDQVEMREQAERLMKKAKVA